MTNYTVLLVDDDPNLSQALRRAWRREEYEVLLAEDGASGLEVLKRHSVDVVISDEAMPGMAGTEFLARVRSLFPDTVRMMLTGNASLETALQAINAGEVYRFFTKPCRADELAVAVRQALEHRRLLVQSRALLATVRRQGAALDELEQETRGLTHVRRDESGAILVDDTPVDLETLVTQIETELETANRRFANDASRLQHPGSDS